MTTRSQLKRNATNRRLGNLKQNQQKRSHQQKENISPEASPDRSSGRRLQQSTPSPTTRKRRRNEATWSPDSQQQKRRCLQTIKITGTAMAPKSIVQQMSHEDILKMQHDAGLTDNQLRKVMQAHRKATNNSRMYQPNFRTASSQLKQTVSNFFEASPYAAHPPLITRPSVNCNDITGLLQMIEAAHERQINRLHLGADFGKGFLKIDFTAEFCDEGSSTSLSDLGRRRVQILSCTPMVQEKYIDMYALFDRLKYPLQKYRFSICADLKLIAIILGISTGASRYPCPFCEQRLQAATTKEVQLTSANLRTISNITANFEDLQAAGDLQNHKAFKSCQHLPLPIFDSLTAPVIDFVMQPELHYLIGIFNWLYKLLIKALPAAEKWPQHFYILPSNYHGGAFEGNQCRRLLNKDAIRQLLTLTDLQHPHARRNSRHHKLPQLLIIADTLQTFSRVVHSSFGKKLIGDWESDIDNFTTSCLLIDVKKYPVKVHAVCCHVKQRCRTTSRGLGTETEQSLESCHGDFFSLWSNSYSITNTNNPRYNQQLLRCVIDYNSKHIPHKAISTFVDHGRGHTLMTTGMPHIAEGPSEVLGASCSSVPLRAGVMYCFRVCACVWRV